MHLSGHIPCAEHKMMSHEDVEECNDNQWNGIIGEELYHHHHLTIYFTQFFRIWGAYLWKQYILVSLENKAMRIRSHVGLLNFVGLQG
jgi:hypothetical protein